METITTLPSPRIKTSFTWIKSSILTLSKQANMFTKSLRF